MLPSLEKEGAPGVVKFIRHVGDELRFIMSCTGFEKVKDIDPSALHYNKTEDIPHLFA